MKKYFLLSLLLMTTIAEINSQRKVVWVHGWNADSLFWRSQARHFSGATYSRRTYDTRSVEGFANDIQRNNSANSNRILITHSMGGLAARQLNRTNPNYYGGVIAFGAPFDGAPIMNALGDGSARRFLDHSKEQLLKGPNAVVSRSWLERGLDMVWNIRGTIRSVFNAIPTAIIFGVALGNGNINVQTGLFLFKLFASTILSSRAGLELSVEFGIDGIRNGFDGLIRTILSEFGSTVEDLKVSSDYINRARNYSSSIPKVVLWGDEDYPRFLNLIASTEEVEREASRRTVFEAYNTLKQTYNDAANQYKPKWYCIINCNSRRRVSNAFREGHDYLHRGMETRWMRLIGAERVETTTRRIVTNGCVQPNNNRGNGRTFGGVIDNSPILKSGSINCLINETITTSRTVTLPSDGLLPRNTQRGDASRWTKTNTTIVRLEGVNHNEMGEHEESQDVLENIFRGREEGYDPFFRTTY